MNLPHFRFYLALPLSIWWVGHFLFAPLLRIAVANLGEATRLPLLGFIWAQMMILGFTFAANLYLLLALGALVRRLDVLRTVWRWRLAVDLAIVLLAAALRAMNPLSAGI